MDAVVLHREGGGVLTPQRKWRDPDDLLFGVLLLKAALFVLKYMDLYIHAHLKSEYWNFEMPLTPLLCW